MKILIIAPSCSADMGGNSLAIYRWVQMIKDKIEVWFLSFDQTSDPWITQRFSCQNFPDTHLSKIKKMWNYYKTDYTKPTGFEKPDVVQIHTPYLWAMGKHFPNVPKILFEHDINWNLLRYSMFSDVGFKKLPFKQLWYPWLLWRATQYEKKILLEAEHIFVYSNIDKKEIVQKLPKLENKITMIPNSLNPSDYPSTESSGNTVLFMGSLNYSANADAIDTICQELAPRLPNLPFKILGEGAYTKNSPQNVEFMGFVPNILPYLSNARVFIVPLRYGSGTRFKIVEALAMQRPVVSTPKGAEGLEVTHGLNIWIEQDWKRFADAIERLWHRPEEGQKLGREGRKLIEEKYNYKKHSDSVIQIYQNVIKELLKNTTVVTPTKAGCPVKGGDRG